MNENREIYSIRKKVLSYIEENELLSHGSTVIIGLSGGADSVCLFDILNSLKEELQIKIAAVHVHHGIREKSADFDATFVSSMCEKEGIDCKIVYRDIPALAAKKGKTTEECAREERYNIFNEEAHRYDNSCIAVAHHIEDQAETVVFRMIRGTGIKGLGGMKPRNGIIIRPLLCLEKEEILSYLEERGLKYCTDETNYDDKYSRNNIRLNILPKAKEIAPKASVHIADCAREAAMVEEFMEEYCNKIYERAVCKDATGIDVTFLDSEKEIVKRYVIRKLLEDAISSLKDITREHVNAVYGLFSKEGYKAVNLPYGCTASRRGRCIIIEKGHHEEDVSFDSALDFPARVILPDGRYMKIEVENKEEGAVIPQSLYTKWLDYDKISAGAHLRYPKDEDYLVIDANGATKSLRRYMIDEKIPKPDRDKVLILATDDKVHWVIGHRISEDVKITDTTNRIVKLEIEEGEERNE